MGIHDERKYALQWQPTRKTDRPSPVASAPASRVGGSDLPSRVSRSSDQDESDPGARGTREAARAELLRRSPSGRYVCSNTHAMRLGEPRAPEPGSRDAARPMRAGPRPTGWFRDPMHWTSPLSSRFRGSQAQPGGVTRRAPRCAAGPRRSRNLPRRADSRRSPQAVATAAAALPARGARYAPSSRLVGRLGRSLAPSGARCNAGSFTTGCYGWIDDRMPVAVDAKRPFGSRSR